jgi:hypothetical protein
MEETPRHETDFELQLLRKSVSMLVAGRARCTDCHRTPLVGERIHVYRRGTMVCDLCRPHHEQDPERSEIVHGAEHGHAVRAAARVAG